MRGRELFAAAEAPLNFLSIALAHLPPSIRIHLLRRWRGCRGILGLGLRYCALRAIRATTSPNVSIHEDVYILNPQGLTIGRNVSVHPMCYLDAAGTISIGDDVSIAHGVTMMSTTHEYSDTVANIKDQPVAPRPTAIENNCWIGAQAVILSGVRIGQGSVIGANSVVTRDIPPGSVAVGSPARIVRVRQA